jgi:hypothetical protein
MPVELAVLKEKHQQKLFEFIAPAKEYRKYQSNETALQGGKNVFEQLVGMSQADLDAKWKTDKTFTTCNTFIGRAANEMGAKQLKAPDKHGGQLADVTLGQFEIATWLAAHGMSNCWVPYREDIHPQYGDIFRAEEYHMGFSLDVEADGTWHTIESGQGGPSSGWDAVARKKQRWGTRKLLGWVSMKMLLNDLTPLPYWLGGWWEITEHDGKTYFYYFDTNNCVYFLTRRPLSNLAPPPTGSFAGSYNVVKNKFQTLELSWFTNEPEETLTFATHPKKANEKVRDASRDTVSGKTIGGKPLKGKRLAGPSQTGLTYEQSHGGRGAGDTSAQR